MSDYDDDVDWDGGDDGSVASDPFGRNDDDEEGQKKSDDEEEIKSDPEDDYEYAEKDELVVEFKDVFDKVHGFFRNTNDQYLNQILSTKLGPDSLSLANRIAAGFQLSDDERFMHNVVWINSKLYGGSAIDSVMRLAGKITHKKYANPIAVVLAANCYTNLPKLLPDVVKKLEVFQDTVTVIDVVRYARFLQTYATE